MVHILDINFNVCGIPAKGGLMGKAIERLGYDRLWLWFGLSRNSWVTLPRVMMHEMPDDWQDKMAALLEEWDETYTNQPDLEAIVCIKENNKFIKCPEFILNYRHPDKKLIKDMMPNNPAIRR